MPGERNARNEKVAAVRLALLVAALAAIAYGVLNGELQVAFAKGIRVCLECIGIA